MKCCVYFLLTSALKDVLDLNNTLKELSEKLEETKEELANTPKTIDPLSNAIPNPTYLCLTAEIGNITARIVSCTNLISQSKRSIELLKNIIDMGDDLINYINDIEPELSIISTGTIDKSNYVMNNMTKIKRVISRYINIAFSLGFVNDIETIFDFEPKKYGGIIARIKSNYQQVCCRREELAGLKHPISGVPYERLIVKYSDGTTKCIVTPRFKTYFTATIPIQLYGEKERTKGGQFEECTRQLREAILKDWRLKQQFDEEQIDQIMNLITPRGYTWHHEVYEGKISLVKTDVHKITGHTGGRNLWGGGSSMR